MFLKIVSEGVIPLFFQGSAAAYASFAAGYVLIALIAYLLGSINFALVIFKRKIQR